jgi:hypothetical protein
MTNKFNEESENDKAKYSSMLEELEKDYFELQTKYNRMSSLIEEKAQLDGALATEKSQLALLRAEHTAHINELERQSVAERERLKKDMISKIRENSKRFERMTEDQLHTTTLTTIQMHQSFVDELADQSSKTESLLAANKTLTATHKTLRLQLEVHESTEKMLLDRASQFQKKIRSFNESFKVLAVTQKEWESKLVQQVLIHATPY